MMTGRWGRVRRLASAVVLMAAVGTAFGQTDKARSAPSEPGAVPNVTGNVAPNALAWGLIESPVGQGSQPLENGTEAIPFYGYNGDGPMVPAPGDVQAPATTSRRRRREPDKNTYLVLDGQVGPDPNYDYGTPLPVSGTRDAACGLHHARSTSTPTPPIG